MAAGKAKLAEMSPRWRDVVDGHPCQAVRATATRIGCGATMRRSQPAGYLHVSQSDHHHRPSPAIASQGGLGGPEVAATRENPVCSFSVGYGRLLLLIRGLCGGGD